MPTITVNFKLSKSRSGEQTLYEAAGLTTVKQHTDEQSTSFSVRLTKDKIRHAFGLLKSLKRLKNKQILVDGKRSDYDTAFGFLPCYQKRINLGSPKQYCFGNFEDHAEHNLFGCVQTSFFDFGSAKYGRWDQKRSLWIFDKKTMMKALDTELTKYQCCPAFDRERLYRIVSALPNGVNPLIDKDWAFNSRMYLTDQEKKKSTLVKIKRPNGTELWYVEGVRIVGEPAIEKIHQKAGIKPFSKGLEWVCISVNLNEQ
jgi:hypothetical protein